MRYFCDVCHGQNGKHVPRCPYYDPEPITTCDLCGAEIYLGDRVVRHGDTVAHSECFLDKFEKEET